jgi:hypothetical protein
VSSRSDAAIALRFKQCYITNIRSTHLQYAAEQLPLARFFAMRLFRFFVALSAFLWVTEATNDGLTDVIYWDSYSLNVNGSRVFVL